MRADRRTDVVPNTDQQTAHVTARKRLSASNGDVNHSDARRHFINALQARGLKVPKGELIADGHIHRCDVADKGPSGRGDGSYAFYSDGPIPAGWFNNWTDGRGIETWHLNIDRQLTAEEKREIARAVEKARSDHAALLAETQARARLKAKRLWTSAEHDFDAHRYCKRKKVEPVGLRIDDDGCLLVPVKNEDGKLVSLQFIKPDGNKRFLKGSRVKGCHHWVTTPKQAEDGNTICVCEGWATGESIYQATRYAVVVSFNASNLAAVAKWVHQRYPDSRVVICADDDWKTDGNPGVREAKKAARVVNGLVAVPEFGKDRADGETDFNNMLNAFGAKEVKRAIDAAVPEEEDDEEENELGHINAKQADILIGLASKAKLFHDDTTGHADISVDGHRESWPIRSRGFRDWLLHRYYNQTQSAPSGEAIRIAIETIGAKARFEAPQRDIFIRVGGYNGKIYLDLCNKEWEAVEIDEKGWRLVDKPLVRFRRAPGMEPLPIPMKGGSVEDLRPFVNVADDADFILLVSWLLAAYRDRGPYPGLGLKGDEGSAKSTLARILRLLTDPSKVKERRLPREDRDLHIHANNSHVLAFGNVSALPDWLSDSLCSLATGGGFATRTLYTDQDEQLFNAMRPVILNGIEFTTRSDLADRVIFLKLPPIRDAKRRTEQDLWDDFEAKRPYILGALLDVVSHGLRELPNTPKIAYPRMADFAHWITACESALWELGSFKDAYANNRAEASLDVLEADPIAVALRLLTQKLAKRKIYDWSDTAANLLTELDELVGEKESKRKHWPGSAAVLGQRLRRLKKRLQQSGIEISFDDRHAKKRLITIEWGDTKQGPQNAVIAVTPVIPDKFQRIRDDGNNDSRASRAVTTGVTANALRNRQNDGNDGNDGTKHGLPSSGRRPFRYRSNRAAREKRVMQAVRSKAKSRMAER